MRFIAGFFIFSIACMHVAAQNHNNQYDSVLAKKLHADNYGMKNYYLVLLKKGPANITDSAKLDSIFKGHMKNIQWLASQNKLVIAGPLGDNVNHYEGIFILNTQSKMEAEKMLATDPAIESGDIIPEYYLLYSSAALQQLPTIHNTIQKDHF